ncbi:MAG: CDP-alcohol phosphatidyltransferase family protein [Candidatus Saliniplasma sp.]
MKIKETFHRLSAADYVTLTNGLLGFLAITYIIDGRYILSSKILILCIGLDGLDGYLARKLDKVHELGSYMDMFSDMISFCFAPAMLVYSSYYNITLGRAWECPINGLATIVPMMIVFFGVLRLSRFADIKHNDKIYTGLPTPLYTLFILSTTYFFGWGEIYKVTPYLPLSVILIISLLLYSNIEYPKLRGIKRKLIGLFFLIIAIIGFSSDIFSDNIGNIFIWIILSICTLYILLGPILVDKYDYGKREDRR